MWTERGAKGGLRDIRQGRVVISWTTRAQAEIEPAKIRQRCGTARPIWRGLRNFGRAETGIRGRGARLGCRTRSPGWWDGPREFL
jgi:hypothetical protein